MKRLIILIALSAFFAFCFQTFVYFEFDKIRNNLIGRSIPAAGRSIDVFFSRSDLRDGRILHIRLSNEENQQGAFVVKLNALPIAQITIPAAASKNISVELTPDLRIRQHNKLMFVGNIEGWSLDRLVLANLYGSNQGIFKYVIVPSKGALYRSPALWMLPVLFVVFLFFGQFLFIYGFSKTKAIIAAGTLLFCLGILLLPQFSPYRLLLSGRAFFLLLLPFYLTAVPRAYVHLYRSAERLRPGYGKIFQSVLVVACVCWFFFNQLTFNLNEFQGNWSRFLWLEEKYLEKNPFLKKRPKLRDDLVPTTEGYDAQFFYYMAYDPALQHFEERPQQYRKVVDNPPHRYRRIGFPLLTKLFSLNQPECFPRTMVLLIFGSHLFGAFVLSRIAVHYGRSAFLGLLYLLIPAFTGSLRVGLPESISCAFLLTGIFFYLKQRILPAVIFFACSLLVRETGLFVLLFLVVQEIWIHKNIKRGAVLCLGFIPYFLWRGFVTYQLFPDYGWAAFFYEGPNFDLPFRGILELVQNEGAQKIFFPLLLTSALVISIFQVRRRKDFLAWSAVVYATLAISLSYSQVWMALNNAERNTSELFVVLILSFLSVQQQSTKLKRIFVAFWLLLLIYDLNFLSAATIFRAGIWYPFQS